MNEDDDKPVSLDDASLQGSGDRPRDPDMQRRIHDAPKTSDSFTKEECKSAVQNVVPIKPETAAEVYDLKMISSYGDEFHNYTVALAMKYGASREISIAQTKIDEAVMWLLKFVAGREGA